jgi:pimeloyl-ACP methyl ester carboxylesterase
MTTMAKRIGILALAAAVSPLLAEEKEPWTHHYYTVSDGTKLHYVEMGQGTPVILVHGAGGSAVGNWFSNGIAPALADTNRVIGIDMRGHALSEDGPPGGRTKMAADVLELMAQLGIEKAHIGGYSMGGGVTLSLLVTNPEKFLTAHFGGSGIGETEEWREKVPADKEGEAPEEAKARAAYQRIQEERRAQRGSEVGNNPRDVARMRAGQPEVSDAERERLRQEYAARRAEQLAKLDLSKIDFPVLAVNGEYDRPYAKTHRMWRELDDFTNVVLPGHGHLSAVMPGFIPQRYIDSLADFIKNNNPQ